MMPDPYGDRRKPRRFRITVEGVTRYVGDTADSADVTLTMPQRFRSRGDVVTDQLMLGSMPLDDVEWITPPLQPGDNITSADQLDALPPWSVIRNAGSSGLAAQKDALGRWHVLLDGYIVEPRTILAWRDGAYVLHVAEAEQ